MAQETEALSRAISTAMFLMAPPPEAKEKKVWDAANRQVVTLKESPLQDLVGINPSGNSPSSCSSYGERPGQLVRFNTETEATDHPASPTPSSGSPSVRTSLTGYQWGGGSPTAASAAAASSGSSRRSSTIGAVPISPNLRPKSLDLQHQNASNQQGSGSSVPSPQAAAGEAAPGDGQQHPRSSVHGRRGSLELPLTPEWIRHLHQQVCSTDGNAAATSAAGDASASAEAGDEYAGMISSYGRSRRSSLLLPATAVEGSASAEAAEGYQGATYSCGRSRRSSLILSAAAGPRAPTPVESGDGFQGPSSPYSRSRRSSLMLSRAGAAALAAPADTLGDGGDGSEGFAGAYGKSRRSSLLLSRAGSVATAGVAAESDSFKPYSESLGIKSPSSDMPSSQLIGSHNNRYSQAAATAAMEAAAWQPEGSSVRRSLDVPRKQSGRQQPLHTASSLAALGAGDVSAALSAAAGVGTAAGGSGLRSPVKPLYLPKAHSSPAPDSDHTKSNNASNFNRSQSVHPAHRDSGGDTSRYSYKPFVPQIDVIDRHALRHAAESDCTAYQALLGALHDVQRM